MPKRGHCIFKSIMWRNARCSKSYVKRAMKVSRNSVWDVPKPFKIEAWAAKRQPRPPLYRSCPRAAINSWAPLPLMLTSFFQLIFIPSKPSQTFPKPFPKPSQNQYFCLFFLSFFLLLSRIDFLLFFSCFRTLRNLKNRVPVEAKCLFLQNRRFRCKSKNWSKNHRNSNPKIKENSKKIVKKTCLKRVGSEHRF